MQAKNETEAVMLTDELFRELVTYASLASSADNMQPWEFRRLDDRIEVFYAKSRSLPTDTNDMFGWIGVGAAIQNMVVAASAWGKRTRVQYPPAEQINPLAAILSFSPDAKDDQLINSLVLRSTNRSPYKPLDFNPSLIPELSRSIQGLNAGIHWATEANDLDQMARMDANSSYIRLEHKPLCDELFNVLRFSQEEIESSRYGLDFASLEVPPFAVIFAKQLRYRGFNRVVSQLGIGRIIARKLASRLRYAGALCLITATQHTPDAYMEAGRAMEQLWIYATSLGLSLQPYGVLPQYIAKAEKEPETLLPGYVKVIKKHREQFFSIFREAQEEYPAILLRIGNAAKQAPPKKVRLTPEQQILK